MKTRQQQMLDWLEQNQDRDVIKIVTGVRGCGKSELLRKYAEVLEKNGVEKDHIITIQFEHTKGMHTPEDLMDVIDERVPAEGKVFLLLDEVCELQEFDVALGTLFAVKRYNIIATCSNRRPISPRFAEYLSGCYVYIVMIAPAFREHPAPANASFSRRLNDCLTFGSLPYTFGMRTTEQHASVYLTGLWNTILVKDILTRNRMADSRFTERLLERIYTHLGESESLRKISADATIEGHEAAPNTVQSYLDALDESMLVRRVPKYDVFLGEKAKGGYKFYIADVALGRNRYGGLPPERSNVIRNLIYLELVGRGGNVYCGRYDNEDFDFVVLVKGRAHCYQYAPETVNGRIPTAMLGAFKRMPGNMPKTIITGKGLPQKPAEGINFITLEEFLTGKKEGSNG